MTKDQKKNDIKKFIKLAEILREKDAEKFQYLFGKVEGLTENLKKENQNGNNSSNN